MKVSSIIAIVISIVIIIIAIIITIYFIKSPQILEYNAFKSLHCSLNPKCVENTEIPKIIYRTSRDKNLSSSHKKAWEFTAKHNPDFKQVLFDDNDVDSFMKEAMNGQIYDIYSKIVPGAAKADLFRYVLMYEKGGIYLDIKSGAKELCKLILPNDKMIVSTWGHSLPKAVNILAPFKKSIWKHNYAELQQWWLICSPKHPLMLNVIIKVVNYIDKRIKQNRCDKESKLGNYTIDVLETTGPLIFTETIEEEKEKGLDSLRLTCADGNGIMIYDVDGKHKKNSYNKKGKLLDC